MSKEFTVRKPAVAGMFYPANSVELKQVLSAISQSEKDKVKRDSVGSEIIGGIVPHAGYIYSGYEAFHFFELIRQSGQKFDTMVIFNPDHQGYCSDFAASPHEYWETPLGKLNVDIELASFFPQSEIAHRMEHSAEVMLPFIQSVLTEPCQILPISIGNTQPEKTSRLAEMLYSAIKVTKHKVIVIASSDFSHYVEPELGIKLDNIALEKIITFNPEGLFEVVKKHRLSVCGYGPIMTLLYYSKLASFEPKATILARGNSGKHSSSDSVVDYITLAISK